MFSGNHKNMLRGENERDGCGVGFVADLSGQADHSILAQALIVLAHLEHRGAVAGDKATGDGAGILFRIPHVFLREILLVESIELPQPGDYAVAMTFFPRDRALKERCRAVMERTTEAEGGRVLGWRAVPANSSVLGAFALSTEPVIMQMIVHRAAILPANFERKLYVIRRLIEKEISSWNPTPVDFYISSFSSHKIVYKGLMTAQQLAQYYRDFSDTRLASPVAVVHQRYSTNTLPAWKLAQPFRFVAHNGEINTLTANINRIRIRESLLKSDLFGDDIEKIKPVIVSDGSDSSIFDNVLELLAMGGRSLPHAMMMMIPEAFGPKITMSEDKRAFYEYHSALMEPWDGPAAMVFADGRYTGGILDRNGLRPARYTITHDGLIVLASETGTLDIEPKRIQIQDRLRPGRMLLVDHDQKRIVPDKETKAKISRQKPYRRWVRDNQIQLRGLFAPSIIPEMDDRELYIKLHAFGYTEEDLKTIIAPMAVNGQEAVGSMGNDTPLAILSERPQLFFNYFKQKFAQVTNPPIDPLREELVMSLESFVGGEGSLLEETPGHFYGFKLKHPLLTPDDLNRLLEANHPRFSARQIATIFEVGGEGKSLKAALETLFEQAELSVRQGSSLLVLTDRGITVSQAPIPILLAVSGLHLYLTEKGLRNSCSIIVESGWAREVMHCALLVSYGADAICPYLAYAAISHLARTGMLEGQTEAEKAVDSYIIALKKGLLKTMSRLGISTLHSFFSSQPFEAIGIDESVCRAYFTGTVSRIGGLDLNGIAREVRQFHQRGFPEREMPKLLLDLGGMYQYKHGGENHLWSPDVIRKLQLSTRADDYSLFKEYTREVNETANQSNLLRSLLFFRETVPVPLEEVEPVEMIVKRFAAAAMSYGSISKEAHETIALAMNQLGAKSNSGEGGEDPARFQLLADGSSKRSRIKQIASGRFGITPEYLVQADELQIKIAQGAKPGEGGQLPGHKVTADIARVRHTTPGVTLISPPPHHDIYSIEDIAQLIFDLRAINPQAEVSVKLVSMAGLGPIASGVAKAKADRALISGYDGGTGASPLTAIKHAGIPWEMGLTEAHQSLIQNGLRDRIILQVDGQLKTGRDLAIATLLGAEEFGFGTSLLVNLGCVLLRKCHLNTCSAGIATQDPELRKRFRGKVEYITRYLTFLAMELREYMAMLGFRSLAEMVGHSELLEFRPSMNQPKTSTLDLSGILCSQLDGKSTVQANTAIHPFRETTLDEEWLSQISPALERGEPVTIERDIRNVYRTIGARTSYEITRRFGSAGLPEDTLTFNFRGYAGQSYGAFLSPGMTLYLEGGVNDYMGKSMGGGKIILKPPQGSTFLPHMNIIAGNVALYGATSGDVFINGQAGERFAVRNSGARAVVEGVGDHGCEYMTGGIVVVIGPVGNNFAAGMSGGIAYIYDDSQLFDTRCNLDMVDLESVWNASDKNELRSLLEKHWSYTQSARARMILDNWDSELPLFVKVFPIDYKRSLERMRLFEEMDMETVSATEEVYHG